MWLVTQSGELVNIAEARWVDCVAPGGSVAEWQVRAFFTGLERGSATHILFRSDKEIEAKAVFNGIVSLSGAYRIPRVFAAGLYAQDEQDTGGAEGRVLPLIEPVLGGSLRDIK